MESDSGLWLRVRRLSQGPPRYRELLRERFCVSFSDSFSGAVSLWCSCNQIGCVKGSMRKTVDGHHSSDRIVSERIRLQVADTPNPAIKTWPTFRWRGMTITNAARRPVVTGSSVTAAG